MSERGIHNNLEIDLKNKDTIKTVSQFFVNSLTGGTSNFIPQVQI